MKTWMLLVGLFALLVVPAMANETDTDSIDITCSIDDYVMASIYAESEELSIIQDDIDIESYAATSDSTNVYCSTEANCLANVTLTATPFKGPGAGVEELKTNVAPLADAYANEFAIGTAVEFDPIAGFFTDIDGVLDTAAITVPTIASFQMIPAGTFDPASGNLDGARRIDWGYSVYANNQTLTSPTLIALSGDYVSTWTLTITKTPATP